MNNNDLIKVAEDDPEVPFRIKGEYGFIEEIVDDFAMIILLTKDGRVSGSGSIRLKYLEKINDPVWLAIKQKYDEQLRANLLSARKRAADHNDKLNNIAKKYDVPFELVKDIEKLILEEY